MDITDDLNSPAAVWQRKLSHAYISPEIGTAEKLAAAAVCQGPASGSVPCGKCAHCVKAARGLHPDIITAGLLPDKRELLVDQIRAIKDDVIVVPNEADKKVYIIKDADSMNKAAQNALLRVLEEPPSHAMFILVAENPAELLETVRSRCVELRREPVPYSADENSDFAEEFFRALDSGALSLTEFTFKLDKLEKNELTAFLGSARKLAITKLRTAQTPDSARIRLSMAEYALRTALGYLSQNVAAAHIGGFLLASLIMPRHADR